MHSNIENLVRAQRMNKTKTPSVIKTLVIHHIDASSTKRKVRTMPSYPMKSLLPLVTLFCSIVAISACGNVAEQADIQSSPAPESDVAAIETVIREVGAALSAGDGPRWGESFTDDAVVMRPGEPSTIGREANIARMQLVFDENELEIAFSVEEVLLLGDWAFARATYSETITPKEGGEPEEVWGKSVNLLQRQSDGSWKIERRMGHRNPSPGAG